VLKRKINRSPDHPSNKRADRGKARSTIDKRESCLSGSEPSSDEGKDDERAPIETSSPSDVKERKKDGASDVSDGVDREGGEKKRGDRQREPTLGLEDRKRKKREKKYPQLERKKRVSPPHFEEKNRGSNRR